MQVDGPDGTDWITRTNYITVYTPVSTDFSATPLTGTYPLTVTFTNHSAGDYTDLRWDFGDGVIATVMNPTHTFSTRGSFTVTLTASGGGGTSTITRTNYITTYAPIQAAFAANPLSGTRPLTVTFSNQSTGDYTDLLWDFGDGQFDTSASPTHVYTTHGSFTVTLAARGPGGPSTQANVNYITTYEPVHAAFVADPISGTYPLTVTFTNQSSGDYTNVVWDFGDGVTSSILSPSHVYESIGLYTVTLNIAGLGGTDAIVRPELIQVVKPKWKFYLPILSR